MSAYEPLGQTDDSDTALLKGENEAFFGADQRVTGAKSSSREVSIKNSLNVEEEESSTLRGASGGRESVLAIVEHGESIDLDEDVYGAAVFTITFDSYELISGKDHDGLSNTLNIYRMTFVLFLLAMNYVLQFSLLYWIYSFVALPAAHVVQELYREFHESVFAHGKMSSELWDGWGTEKQDEICSVAFVSFDFMYAVLCIWWMQMLVEIRKTERTMRKFKNLAHCDVAEEMIVKTEDEHLVVKLTTLVRALLWFFLLIPKFMIALALTFVGTMWLAATDSYSDLILNAVALQFVVKIDEMLFDGLLPESIKSDIGSTKLLIPKKLKSGNAYVEARNEENQVVAGFKRSTLYAIFLMGIVYLFMTVGQDFEAIGLFPGSPPSDIASSCPTWYEENAVRVCRFGKDCFPIRPREAMEKAAEALRSKSQGHASTVAFHHHALGHGHHGRR